MGDVEIQMSQLLNLAIGTPEIGAVNFNLLQKFLSEVMKCSDLESVPVKVSAEEITKFAPRSGRPEPTSESTAETEQQKSFSEVERRRSLGIDPAKIDQILEDLTQLKLDVDDLSEKVTEMSAATETVPFQDMRSSIQQVDGIQDRLKMVEGLLENVKDLSAAESGGRTLGQRLQYLEAHVDNHSETLTKVNSILDVQLKSILEKFAHMEQDLGELHERLNLATTTTAGIRDKSTNGPRLSIGLIQEQSASINSLISRLSTVQQDLDNLTSVTTHLTEEQESRNMAMDVLTEQIEMLKLTKAEKTNMEDILAAKADLSQVHRKVSHEHFEVKMEEFNEQMNDAFSRLDAHEEMWQDEVEELKTDIENKLDKGEFSPLKDYVNDKLKLVQDKMKNIASQRKEGVAAGSKKKMMKDVQCISCDNETLMRTENTMEEMMPSPGLPTQQSVKPYLTYKLDQVRKQQKKLPTGRNLLHFEEMLHDHPQKMHFPQRNGEQLVNRYVGGSHTITTPVQRLTRQGNFFETWGPIITAVNTPQ